VLGTFATLPAAISGLVAHIPYEATGLIEVIGIHQRVALAGTAITLAVLGWRWRSRRAGRDVGTTPLYLGVVGVGLLWLVVLGGTGGQLVYEYGINVRGVNRMSTLAYFDGCRSDWLPANLIQAQRDYFGAHTYGRVDAKGVFHTRWSQE